MSARLLCPEGEREERVLSATGEDSGQDGECWPLWPAPVNECCGKGSKFTPWVQRAWRELRAYLWKQMMKFKILMAE